MKKPILIATHSAGASADDFAAFLRGDNSRMRCTLCDAPMGKCDCWTKCSCGWSFEKGTACRNPNCPESVPLPPALGGTKARAKKE